MKTIKLTIALMMLGLLAANPSAHAVFGMGEPPLALTQRDSLDGGWMVVIITNTSDEPLHQVTIGATNHKREQELEDVVVAVTLEPHKSVEVGGEELKWGFEPGESVRVGARGYSSYVRARISE